MLHNSGNVFFFCVCISYFSCLHCCCFLHVCSCKRVCSWYLSLWRQIHTLYSHWFSVLPPFLHLFGLARFPSFCHASFSLCFLLRARGWGEAGRGVGGREACLLTLSPEGSGISQSKYVSMSTTREETMGCLLADAGLR